MFCWIYTISGSSIYALSCLVVWNAVFLPACKAARGLPASCVFLGPYKTQELTARAPGGTSEVTLHISLNRPV